MATDGAQNQSQEMLTGVYLTTFTPPLQSLTVMDSKWMVRDENKVRFHLFRDFTKSSQQCDFRPLLHHLATTMLREQPQAPDQGSAGICIPQDSVGRACTR